MTKIKITRKNLVVCLAGICLVAAVSVGITLAYLTSVAQVVNTFTVGNLKITLEEPSYTEPSGETVLLPGMEPISKDPTVTLEGEDAYVFMKLDIPESFEALIEYPVIGDKWEALTGEPGVYIYKAGEGEEPYRTGEGELQPLFEKIVVSDFDSEDADLFKDGLNKSIVVKAAAIQFSGCSLEDAIGLLDWDAIE